MLISVDHGNKLIKVLHHAPFTSGLQESDVPPFGGETLKYQGKYYTLSEKRIPYHRDKTEDDRFWILTLFAIAYEIEAVGGYSQNIIRIQLAVGLPPAHYGAQCEAFTGYFTNRGAVKFEFRGRTYSIYVEKALCFPQSYAHDSQSPYPGLGWLYDRLSADTEWGWGSVCLRFPGEWHHFLLQQSHFKNQFGSGYSPGGK